MPLEQGGHQPACLQFGAQVAHHAFDLSDHDGDGDRVWRFGDAGGGIAFRRAHGDADKLPRRHQPANDQDEPMKKNVGFVCRGRCRRSLRRRGFKEGDSTGSIWSRSKARRWFGSRRAKSDRTSRQPRMPASAERSSSARGVPTCAARRRRAFSSPLTAAMASLMRSSARSCNARVNCPVLTLSASSKARLMSSLSALASAGIRSRPIHSQIGSSDTRAMRQIRLWSGRRR